MSPPGEDTAELVVGCSAWQCCSCMAVHLIWGLDCHLRTTAGIRSETLRLKGRKTRLQEDRFGVLQLTQPDITATLQLLLSAQLALQTFARRALPPRPPTLVGRLWGVISEALRRRLGFTFLSSGAPPVDHSCSRPAELSWQYFVEVGVALQVVPPSTRWRVGFAFLSGDGVSG